MPDPASSFMVGNAPGGASYAAPLLNFSQLSQYPQDLFQGQQRARTTALQNAFPNGLPKDQNGNVDINGITDTLTKLGGADYATQVLPLLLQSRMGAQGAAAIEGADQGQPPQGGQSGQPPPVNPANVPGASGPANIRGPQAQAAQQQPATGSPDQISMQGNGSRENPYQPKSMADFQQVEQGSYYTTPGGVTTLKGSERGAPFSQNGASAQPQAASGTSGSPAPTDTTAAPQQQAQPQPGSGLVPPGYDPRSYADALNKRAQGLRAQAASVASFPAGTNQAKVLQEQAQAYDDKAKQIYDSINTATQPTPEQKNLASGATLGTAADQAEAKRSSEVYSGIQGAANQYETGLKPYLDLSRSILNDPRVYTGTGGNVSLDINRVKALFGDQNAAVLQEALQKVTASSVLAQINQQKNELMQSGGPGSSGRIFQSQVELVEKAAPQLSTTPAGNRFLVEVASRMGDLSTQVRDMAAQYLQNHKVLDSNFDQSLSTYLKAHPLFNKDELSNPELLGSPSAPPNLSTTQDRLAWGNGIGLNPGDPFRVNGKYQHWNPPKQ